MQKFSKKLLILSFLLLGLPLFTHAQETAVTPDYTASQNINPDDLLLSEKIPSLDEQIDLKVIPENPKPESEVTVEVNMYGADINRLLIVWKINGKEVEKGIGMKKFKFVNGPAGVLTKVDVVIFPKSGAPIQRSLSFSPINVDILWQAKTYTPPFYKGKALFTPESEIEILSFPYALNGSTRIDPNQMVYKWKLNYELDDSASGFGKNTFQFKGPIILRENFFQSTVYSSANPEIQGVNTLKLNHVSPQVVLYEDNPIFGVLYNRSIKGEYTLKDGESKISATPLFFSTKNKNEKVGYVWELDSNKVDVPKYQNSVIFKRNNSVKGSAFLRLIIDNSSHILQRATVSLNLLYEN